MNVEISSKARCTSSRVFIGNNREGSMVNSCHSDNSEETSETKILTQDTANVLTSQKILTNKKISRKYTAYISLYNI